MLARNYRIALPVRRKKESDCTCIGNNETFSKQVLSNISHGRFERSFSQTSASLFPFRGYRTRNHPHLSKSELKRKCLWTPGDFRSKNAWMAQFDPIVVAHYKERQRVEKEHMEKIAMERKNQKQKVLEGQDLFVINKPKVKSKTTEEKEEMEYVKQFLDTDARKMRASMTDEREKDKKKDKAEKDRYQIKSVDQKLGIKKKNTDSASNSSKDQVGDTRSTS